MNDTAAAPDWAQDAEQKVLDQALPLVGDTGWTRRTAVLAGKAAGLSPADVELLLPNGPADLAALFSRRHDARALEALAAAGVDPAALKIRERIRAALEARIDAAMRDEAAVRRWAGWLALPQNLGLAGRLAWETADALWRWAGDTAVDENHYSKRAILAAVLSAAIAVRLQGGRADALAFVDRRIGEVMAFETWKATTKFRPQLALHAAASALGRLRYGRANT